MRLAQETDYLLLDEPLNNLGMAHARRQMELLRDLADRSGRTIVVVLHEVNYAAAYADHIVALRDGCVAGAGRPAELLTAGAILFVAGTPVTISETGGRPMVQHLG